MIDKNVMKVCAELHEFLEDREIYYPQSLFLIDCYKAWILANAEEIKLSWMKNEPHS